MTDITLCLNDKCNVRERCRRATVEPHEWRQSWFCPTTSGAECRYFIEDKGKEKKP